MSLSVSVNNFVNGITSKFTGTPTQPVAGSTTQTPTIASDAVKISSTATPTDAGAWKKISNSVSGAFSDIADKMHIGETYKLASQEFDRIDNSRDGTLNKGEFNVGTLNIVDFMGTEFAKADKNQDGRVEKSEYVSYRKQQLSNVFDSKDKSGDKHLNTNEIGFIGQQLLVNRDPRLDENQDGLVNKREFTRSVIKGSLSIRDFFGI